MNTSAFLHFPRGLSALEISLHAASCSVALWGPGSGGLRAPILLTEAPTHDCWRALGNYPADPLPEKLWLRATVVGLTRQEAAALDEALRTYAPSLLREREAA